ncbi:hypothetical protein OG806_04435 [Streptomyces sp. NBC_00882]|uniref:hypothetical protein n=1 Tax=Streptomyces TaxID=1883 RepID=UPI003866619B|nr:hypothetical protein OG806_04435 [Streptomyces sp. NBC_00882]WSZ55759.1 hypothetical protein OH824_04010 [Streptomyces canus]
MSDDSVVHGTGAESDPSARHPADRNHPGQAASRTRYTRHWSSLHTGSSRASLLFTGRASASAYRSGGPGVRKGHEADGPTVHCLIASPRAITASSERQLLFGSQALTRPWSNSRMIPPL